MADEQAEAGKEWWTRDWSIGELGRKGGLLPLEQIFQLNLDANDPNGSARRVAQAGLLIAFVLDGKNEAVIDKHSKFKAILRNGQDTTEAVNELQKALVENIDALKAFSGLEMAAERPAAAEAAGPAAPVGAEGEMQEPDGAEMEGSGSR
jgi:hypothetical protein